MAATLKGEDLMKVDEFLNKAAKGVKGYFGKAEAHHEKAAKEHEVMAAAHKAMCDHHAEKAKEDGAEKAFHKAAHGFHKTAAAHHEAMHKLYNLDYAHRGPSERGPRLVDVIPN
jgi:hypothetical protein